jgi:hypothetical protein
MLLDYLDNFYIVYLDNILIYLDNELEYKLSHKNACWMCSCRDFGVT